MKSKTLLVVPLLLLLLTLALVPVTGSRPVPGDLVEVHFEPGVSVAASPQSSDLFMVTAKARHLSGIEVLGGVEAASRPGTSTLAQMEAAKQDAWTAAVRLVVRHQYTRPRGMPGVLARLSGAQAPGFDTGEVTGPSAGLTFGLAMADALTDGELTSKRVAVTGEIGPTGTVRAVGRVTEKVRTASRGGVDLVVVPASNAAQARWASILAGGPPVVGVEDLPGAVSVLCGLERSPGSRIDQLCV